MLRAESAQVNQSVSNAVSQTTSGARLTCLQVKQAWAADVAQTEWEQTIGERIAQGQLTEREPQKSYGAFSDEYTRASVTDICDASETGIVVSGRTVGQR